MQRTPLQKRKSRAALPPNSSIITTELEKCQDIPYQIAQGLHATTIKKITSHLYSPRK